MKRFQFPLDGLVKVRTQEVKTKQAQLASASRELAAAETARGRLADALRSSLRTAPHGSVVDVSSLLELERERMRLRHAMEEETTRIDQWLRRVEDERLQLTMARKRAEAVERLRQQRYLDFVRAIVRDEQKETDEVAGRVARGRKAA